MKTNYIVKEPGMTAKDFADHIRSVREYNKKEEEFRKFVLLAAEYVAKTEKSKN